jgi:uncharacterized protein
MWGQPPSAVPPSEARRKSRQPNCEFSPNPQAEAEQPNPSTRTTLAGLRENSQIGEVPWKSGASAPRKASKISAGFSPSGRILRPRRVFPQPVRVPFAQEIRLGCYYDRVPTAKLVALIAVFFFTSVISVVTGSTSLITVPVMIAFGIEAHVAIATNMLALIFMSVGGSLPFMEKGILYRARLRFSVVLTIVGSGLGAFVVLSVPVRALQMVIALAMIAVAVFSLLNRTLGLASHGVPPSRMAEASGYTVTFLLAIYGGFFSGGYVTLLTAAFVMLFGMTFLQAVATTKVINVFSSGVATLVFLWRGIVDVRLGVILGVAMFLGAVLGGRIALLLSTIWLRRIFIAAVLGLAIKMLFSRV